MCETLTMFRCIAIESTQTNRKPNVAIKCIAFEFMIELNLSRVAFKLFNFCFHSFSIAVPLTDDNFKKWRTDFFKCEKNLLAQNVCSRIDPFEAALSRKVLENTQHVFTYKVESEGKPLTNQKNSGRCWLFAALNSIRIPFMKNVSVHFACDFE